MLKIAKDKNNKPKSSNFRSETLRMFDSIVYESNRKILV